MFKHDRLAAFKWCKQMDSVQIVDGSARQNRDRLACEGGASEECLDARDRHQVNRSKWNGHAGVDWEESEHREDAGS